MCQTTRHIGITLEGSRARPADRRSWPDAPMVLCGAGIGPDTLHAMRRRLWSVEVAGLALRSLGMVGGTAIGGYLGPLAAGYGLLVALAALYMVAGLAIRQRVWRRLASTTPGRPTSDRLAGRRVF